ncbi:MAG: EF-Tu/IF-2/RF-3 family GTPase [Planctomycetota bacterium]
MGSITKQATDDVKVEVLHSGVGGITEADVLLAEASKAIILGFRVVPDTRARVLAEKQGVEIRQYNVIYQLLEDLEQAVKGMLAPEIAEEVTGRMEVRQIFKISRVGTVAGCIVTDGVIARSHLIRIVRDSVVVEDQRQIESLRREKDDVREVRAGLECGLKVSGFDDIKVGDVFEAYQMVEVPV